jgi:hypothetical protein
LNKSIASVHGAVAIFAHAILTDFACGYFELLGAFCATGCG